MDDDERVNTGRPLETHGCCRPYYADCRYFARDNSAPRQRSPYQWPLFIIEGTIYRRIHALLEAVAKSDNVQSALVQRQLREVRIRLRVLNRFYF